MSEEQGELFDARKLREIGLDLVLEHNPVWNNRYALTLPLLVGQRVTGERIRIALEPIIGTPTHYNAWGAATMHAIRRDALRATGETELMQLPKGHAHRTPVYVVLGL